jgi:hypothetical protein
MSGRIRRHGPSLESRAARLTLALIATAGSASPSNAADLFGAAQASIQADEAGRHVHVLADDAFEGREAGARGGRAAAAYIVEQLEKLDVEPAGDQGTFYQSFGGMRNILALVRGSDPELARQVVIVGAHYDHVGYGNARNSFGPFGFVHNGADDNASGVAGLLEFTEALRCLPSKPRRSLLIAFWDGEEKGLLGSRHFVRVRPAALAHLDPVFCVNLDMIGRLRGERIEVYGCRTALGLRDAIVRANNDPTSRAGLELTFNWDIEEDSDHHTFIMAGIPTVMFHTGLHDQYHRPSDDVHLVNLPGIEPVMRLTLCFALAIADDPAPPRSFRPRCRSESAATQRGLEALAPEPPQRGRWGFSTRPDPGEPACPVVVRVSRGSPAETAGLTIGDRIMAIAETRVVDQDDMLSRLGTAADVTTITVDRRGRLRQLTLGGDERTNRD